jgi:hypothetical protein
MSAQRASGAKDQPCRPRRGDLLVVEEPPSVFATAYQQRYRLVRVGRVSRQGEIQELLTLGRDVPYWRRAWQVASRLQIVRWWLVPAATVDVARLRASLDPLADTRAASLAELRERLRPFLLTGRQPARSERR